MELSKSQPFDPSIPGFISAINDHKRGELQKALNGYRVVLSLYPSEFEVLTNIGILYLQFGSRTKGQNLLNRSLYINEDQPLAHLNLGSAQILDGNPEQALTHLKRTIELSPSLVEAHAMVADSLARLNQNDKSLSAINRALKLRPMSPELSLFKGTLLIGFLRIDEALVAITEALQLHGTFIEAFLERGRALILSADPLGALDNYNQALLLEPAASSVIKGRCLALSEIKPSSVETLCSIQRFSQLEPGNFESVNLRGLWFLASEEGGKSVACFRNAIALNPCSCEVYSNLGNSFFKLGDYIGSLKHHDKAIRICPEDGRAFFNRATAYMASRLFRNALDDFRRAFELQYRPPNLFSTLIFSGLKVSDSTDWRKHRRKLMQMIGAGQSIGLPFPFLALFDDPPVHRRVAELFISNEYHAVEIDRSKQRASGEGKIVLGYFSSDFREHPVALNLAPVIRAHDRERFHVIAFDFTPKAFAQESRQILDAFDEVIDISGLSDEATLTIARQRGLDIALDLNGHTAYARTGLFLRRLAPIQINYLGYPGTMGSEQYDYLIADKRVIPESHFDYFNESILYLPTFFMPYSFVRSVTLRLNRSDFLLPEEAFIFCSFNDFYKITDEVFLSWMRILSITEGTFLLISLRGDITKKDLLNRADSLAVSPNRIIFAERVENHDAHIARLALCDLMLDTFPYGSHTTACDAILAGLPILTIRGRAFASRVSSSLLEEMGLQELITENQSDYVQRATEIFINPTFHQSIRTRIAKGIAGLTNPSDYTRNLEEIYSMALAKL